jgi:GAF domain-containing protein
MKLFGTTVIALILMCSVLNDLLPDLPLYNPTSAEAVAPKIQEQSQRILKPQGQYAEELPHTYHRHYEQALQTVNTYRLCLYLLAVILLGCIAYIVLRLRNSIYALNLANAKLKGEITERNHAESALAARTRQLEAVREVSEEIARELDLTTLLGLITRRAMELVGAASSVTQLWDEAAQVLMPRAWHGLGDWMQEVRVGLGEGVTGTVAQRRKGMLVNDYRSWPGANPLFLERTGMTAILAEPLLYHGRLLGVISLNNAETGQPFTPQDRDLLALFAHQAAIAIQKARLLEHQEIRATRLQALTRLNQFISGSLDMDHVLSEITKAAAMLMDTPFVRIWIADGATQSIERRAASDEHVDAGYPAAKRHFGQGAAGWVAMQRQPLNVPNVFVEEEIQLFGLDWWRAHNLSSLLSVPIIYQDSLLGVLSLHGRKPFNCGPDDQDLLDSLMAQAAVAIRNARLFAESEARRRAAEALLDIAQALGSTLEQKQVLTICRNSPMGIRMRPCGRSSRL